MSYGYEEHYKQLNMLRKKNIICRLLDLV